MIEVVKNDGVAELDPSFIDSAEATRLFTVLRSELMWHEEFLTIAGRSIKAPRLVCWYGDGDAVYRYSGTDHHPLEWTPTLLSLRERITRSGGWRFNSVLGNLYRDGRDSMGWHADKEKELGTTPLIASLSFGAERLFRLRHNKSHESVDVLLGNGSLLVMSGSLQRCWRHCLPKTAALEMPRINLTFRYIYSMVNGSR